MPERSYESRRPDSSSLLDYEVVLGLLARPCPELPKHQQTNSSKHSRVPSLEETSIVRCFAGFWTARLVSCTKQDTPLAVLDAMRLGIYYRSSLPILGNQLIDSMGQDISIALSGRDCFLRDRHITLIKSHGEIAIFRPSITSACKCAWDQGIWLKLRESTINEPECCCVSSSVLRRGVSTVAVEGTQILPQDVCLAHLYLLMMALDHGLLPEGAQN